MARHPFITHARRAGLVALATLIAGCATTCKEQVPPGHVGECRTIDGFEGKILPPGYHTCWGSGAAMHLIEVTDQEQVISMNVLCKDSLNFKFDVAILSSVDKTNKKLLSEMFENVTPAQGRLISAQQIFDTYARNVVDQEARKVVSQYETSEIVGKRKQILGELRTEIAKALEGSIITVKRVTVNNLDSPVVVTRAQEERARRQVEIETERAEQRKRLLQAQNKLKISELEYQRQILEAAMIADANSVIGASITPQYLAWWQLKTMSEAAQGPNNWGFIPYTDFTNGQFDKMGTVDSAVAAELRAKIEEARKAVRDADAADAAAEEARASREAEANTKPPAEAAPPEPAKEAPKAPKK